MISPCVTFANHSGSTKSYDAVKERKMQLQALGFIEPKEEISVEYEDATWVELHDGSKLFLSKVDDQSHDISNPVAAQKLLFEARQGGQFLTGLFYFDQDKANLVDQQNIVETPLAHLSPEELRPSADQLSSIMANYR